MSEASPAPVASDVTSQCDPWGLHNIPKPRDLESFQIGLQNARSPEEEQLQGHGGFLPPPHTCPAHLSLWLLLSDILYHKPGAVNDFPSSVHIPAKHCTVQGAVDTGDHHCHSEVRGPAGLLTGT